MAELRKDHVESEPVDVLRSQMSEEQQRQFVHFVASTSDDVLAGLFPSITKEQFAQFRRSLKMPPSPS